MYQTASDVLGYPERKHQDWFDEYDEHLKKLLEARNTARQENLQCNTRSRRKKYSKAQSELEKYTREMKWRGVHGYIMGIHGPISAYKGIHVCINVCLNTQKINRLQ